MILRFNEDLTKQEIYANGDELFQKMGYDMDEDGNRVYSYPKDKEVYVTTLENPVLVTDNYKINQIESSTLRDTVSVLYSTPITITEYDDTSIEFEQNKYPGVWGPSIDTLLFCKALKYMDLSKFKNAVEIGSGSGFISKYILENNQELESMTLVDINEHALSCAKYNIDDKRANFFTGDGLELIKGKKYDLIICNPPYIPRPKSISDNPYEGLTLLNYLIETASEHLTENGVFVTNISSMCEKITDETIKNSNVKGTVLESKEVPLKVFNVLNNEKWMDYLLEEKGLKKDRHDGYDYWQKINITKFELE